MADKVICTKCGQENQTGETFCGSCGAFLEWSGERPAPNVPDAVQNTAADGSPSSSGLPLNRPALGQAPDPEPVATRPVAAQPPPVAPVRRGPSRRSIPPGPIDLPAPAAAAEPAPAPAAAVPADPTIACPACGRTNPASRTFCHSCGTRLRARPAAPMAHRRRSANRDGAYRLISIILLIAIILVGSFLVTRLTGSSSAAGPHPSPTRATVTRLRDG